MFQIQPIGNDLKHAVAVAATLSRNFDITEVQLGWKKQYEMLPKHPLALL